jgi:hypothetical protein
MHTNRAVSRHWGQQESQLSEQERHSWTYGLPSLPACLSHTELQHLSIYIFRDLPSLVTQVPPSMLPYLPQQGQERSLAKGVGDGGVEREGGELTGQVVQPALGHPGGDL